MHALLAASMSAYKFTPQAVASPDAPHKPLVRKRACSGGAEWVQVTQHQPGSQAKRPHTVGSEQPACTHNEHRILSAAEATSVASQFWDCKMHPTKASQQEFLATWRLFTGVRARRVLCAVSTAPWRLFTGVCAGLFCVRCPWPLGACSPVYARGVLCVWCPWPLGACSPVCALGVFCVRCPWPLGACSPVCVPGVWCVRCPWPLGACSPVYARGVLCVRCPWPLGACSPVCAPGVFCVRCPWPLGACSPVRTPGVLGVRCPWPHALTLIWRRMSSMHSGTNTLERGGIRQLIPYHTVGLVDKSAKPNFSTTSKYHVQLCSAVCGQSQTSVHIGVEGAPFGPALHNSGRSHCNGLARACGW